MRRANRTRQGAQAGPSASRRPCGKSSRTRRLSQIWNRPKGCFRLFTQPAGRGRCRAPMRRRRYLETASHW